MENSLAYQLIQECIKTKNKTLDLGNCDLNENSPYLDSLKYCGHIQVLNLGSYFYEKEGNLVKSKNKRHINQFRKIPYQIADLVNLISISFAGNKIIKIENFEKLIFLKYLLLHDNRIQKIEEIDNLKQLTLLDLGFNKIKKIENLDKLIKIEKLYLHSNEINQIENLEDLLNLNYIRINANPLNDVEVSFRNKIEKNVSFDYQIKVVKEYLASIPKWKKAIDKELKEKTGTLNLSRCNLEAIPAEVNTMTWLTSLICIANGIQKIENIHKLTKLENLDFKENVLTKIENLEKNTQLKTLGLSDNKIEILENIEHLKKLEKLYLARNQFEDISLLASLPNLKRVLLTGNKITTLQSVLDFTEENKIPISGDYSFNEQETGLFVADNPLTFPPISIIQQGKEALDNYLSSIKEASVYRNKFFKIILIGNSEAGKSAFIKRFVNKKKSANSSTHYLEIEEWKGKDIKKEISSALPIDNDAVAFVYDFGGQEYYHDTHKLYFTHKTLYLLFWENRTNNYIELQSCRTNSTEQIQHYPLSYWLESISYLLQPKLDDRFALDENLEQSNLPMDEQIVGIRNSYKHHSSSTKTPVVIVENKIDLNPNQKATRINQLEYDDYPINIFAFESVGLENDARMNHFKNTLSDVLQELNPTAEELPGYYEKIVKGILSDHKNFESYLIKKTDFFDRCMKIYLKTEKFELLNKEIEQEQMLDYLATKGIIIYLSNYFKNKDIAPEIQDLVIINPELFRKKMHEFFIDVKDKNGVFTNQLIEEKGISEAVLFLKHFKLIFEVDEKEFIAPIYLPTQPQPVVSILLDKLPLPIRRFLFTGYIHKTIIIDTFSSLKDRQSLFHYFWKDGIIISKPNENNTKVFIKFNTQKIETEKGEIKGKCYIEVYQLSNNGSNEFVNEIINSIKKITLGYKVYEQVTANGENFVSLELLNQKSQNNSMQFEVDGVLLKLSDFNKYLTHKFPMKKIFISYAEEDNAQRAILDAYLSTLKRQGLISTWFDRRILPGGNWNKEIQENMRDADIILCLISPDYFKETKSYIWDVEIPIICEKIKENATCVIPVILKNTPDWYSVPIGNDGNDQSITFGQNNWLPSKSHLKSDKFRDESDAWADVAEGIKAVIKQ